MAKSVTEKHLRLTVVFILVARASQDPRIGAVNIPFPFRIDNTDLNSGHHIVRVDKDQLSFTTKEDPEKIDCVAVTAARTESAWGTLAFVECGSRYILCKAFWPSGWIRLFGEPTAETQDQDDPVADDLAITAVSIEN